MQVIQIIFDECSPICLRRQLFSFHRFENNLIIFKVCFHVHTGVHLHILIWDLIFHWLRRLSSCSSSLAASAVSEQNISWIRWIWSIYQKMSEWLKICVPGTSRMIKLGSENEYLKATAADSVSSMFLWLFFSDSGLLFIVSAHHRADEKLKQKVSCLNVNIIWNSWKLKFT